MLAAATFPLARPRYDRGQTLPVWILSILVAFALAFFIFNYSNTVRWQVRAQNAADSAAAAALGTDAAKLNSVNLLLAAFDIQQLKVRDMLFAVPNLLTSGSCGASTLLDSSCINTQLKSGIADIGTGINNLANVQNTLSNFSGQLTDNLANPNATVQSLFAPNGSGGCNVNVLTACDFYYTTKISTDANGVPTVDEYACKKVNNMAAGVWNVMSLFAPNATFYAVGHTTSKLTPMSDLINPSTLGNALQTQFPLYGSTANATQVGSLLGLNINANMYGPAPAPPPATSKTVTDVCPS